jgi:hypothetical protein
MMRTHRTFRVAGRVAGAARMLVSLTLCVGATRATAQAPQPVVMVHGFISSGETWTTAAARLHSEFNVTTTQPNLVWGDGFVSQTSVLRSGLSGFPDTTVFVGHSNGGLISREAHRQGQGAKAIVTIGTLHQGAPLAGHVDYIPAWGGFVFAMNFSPVYYYLWYMGDYNWISWIAGSQAAVMAATGAFMVGYSGMVLDHAGSGALPDMTPGSNFLDGRVNTAASLANEAATLPVRVGIQSYTDNPYFGIMFHGLLGSGGGGDFMTYLQYSSIVWDLIAYDYYSAYWWDYYDWNAWDLAMGAYLWLDAAYTTAAIDPVWCSLAGVLTPTGCEPSDGIVPLRNQYYPGGINYTVRGPAHTDETSSNTTVDQLVRTLRYDVGIAAAPPPPPPPDPIDPGIGCTYSSGVSANMIVAPICPYGAPAGQVQPLSPSSPGGATPTKVSGAMSPGTRGPRIRGHQLTARQR